MCTYEALSSYLLLTLIEASVIKALLLTDFSSWLIKFRSCSMAPRSINVFLFSSPI